MNLMPLTSKLSMYNVLHTRTRAADTGGPQMSQGGEYAHAMAEFLRGSGGAAVIDGGLATELEANGADLKDALWSARCLFTCPDLIRKVHLDYLKAGASVLITGSYQATIQGFLSKGFSQEESESFLRRSVELAREARVIYLEKCSNGSDEAKDRTKYRKRPILIAASVGSYGAYLADGSEYSGDYGNEGTLEFLKNFHRRRLQVLAEAAPDVIVFETIPNKIETQAYVELLEECKLHIPAWFGFTSKDGINVVSGDSLIECASIADSCKEVAAVGINCTPPRFIHELVLSIRKVTSKPILIYPNSGESYDPIRKEWVECSGISNEDFVSYVKKWHEAGASLIGGCCRTSPDTIRGISKSLHGGFLLPFRLRPSAAAAPFLSGEEPPPPSALPERASVATATTTTITIRDGRRMSPETFTVVVEALVKLGKEDEAVRLFRGLERQRLLPWRDAGDGGEGVWSSSLAMVQALCMKGYVREAQGVVWHHKSELSIEPMVTIVQRSLLHGWCVHGNAKEARRVLDDIKSSRTPLGLPSFNDYLHCLCHRNLKFNPSALVPEAMDVLAEMRSYGVTPDASSFNILLSCLGRARRVKESYRILYLMREGKAECSPDWVSYYLVVRVLYLTGRIIRGKRLVDDMLESGVLPTGKFFHGLIGVLCGTEKVDHALDMFRLMKRCQLVDTHAYDLLIEKLCRNGRFEDGKELWNDAKKNGFMLGCSEDLLDPLKTEFLIEGHAILMDSTQDQQQDFGVLLKQGAEGRVFVSTFVGRKCVIKERFSKKYRHPLLDSKLTLKRLNAEARCMTKARKLGVPTPVLYAVDPLLHTLTFEYVDGLSVKDILLGFGSNGINEEQLVDIATQIGNAVGKLHDGGLVHGDLTTSNMIIKNSTNKLVLIDFGLSFISTIPEDKAVDLYVLERALISMHSSCGDVKIFKAMVRYYEQASSSQATGQKANNDRMKLNLDLLDNTDARPDDSTLYIIIPSICTGSVVLLLVTSEWIGIVIVMVILAFTMNQKSYICYLVYQMLR
uniref:Uncharacterized protein n=1 Tax=Oryza punctata TaxID=4537 RepID=A0A0E0M7T1_ORYPU